MAKYGPPPVGGQVRLDPSSGNSLTMILNAPPDRSGGVGGWQPTERSGRRPAKWWQNIPDDTMVLDCTIDIDAIQGPVVEERLRVLRDMGQPGVNSDPPTIQVDGDIWSHDQNVTWVMSDLSLGDRLWNADGTLRRQQVTVNLERFNEMVEIKPVTIHSTRTHGRRRHRTVKTKVHDTLRTVALRELGSGGRWSDLRKWNTKLKHTDPDVPLRAGTHVKING